MHALCVYIHVYTHIYVYIIYTHVNITENFITFNYFPRYVIIQESDMSLVSINHVG